MRRARAFVLSFVAFAGFAGILAAQAVPEKPPVDPATVEDLEASAASELAPQRPPAPGSEAPPSAARVGDEPATLSVWNREIFVFRATLRATPAERARHAAQRIRRLPDSVLELPVETLAASVAGYQGVLISVGDNMLFSIVAADVDPLSGLTLEGAAAGAAKRLRDVLEARARQNRPGMLLGATLRSVAATAFLLLLVVVGYRFRRKWTRRLLRSPSGMLQQLRVGEFELGAYALGLLRWLLGAIGWTLRLIVGYVWLTYVLAQFPLTEPWSAALGGWLLALVLGLARAVLASVPGLVTTAVILLAARGLTRMVGTFFQSVADGRLELAWIYPETAAATRRIVQFGIWIFALALAYPFLPGAQSVAFQGISVLLGLMLSLGSAGILNQVMAGWVVTYSRSLQIGDFVRIGDVEGRVLALGVLAVKVINGRGEEVTIPNAVVTGTGATNFTRQARGGGILATTSVTIGYDAPWRQVHAMLVEAAKRTDGVLAEPPPRVIQRALSDFYPEYDLVVELAREANRADTMTALHGNIQDVFNENGVQILSPHFEAQPSEPVVVPRSAWFTPPAAPEKPR